MFLLDVAFFPSCIVRIFLRTLCGFDTPKILIRQTIRDGHKLIPHILVGGIPTPLKNMSSSVGIIILNQYIYIYIYMYVWKKSCSQPPTS